MSNELVKPPDVGSGGDALYSLVQRWRKLAETHGARTFTGNDHALFANELEAALAARPPAGHTVTVQLGAGLVKCDCGCGSDVCADCGQELGQLIPPAPAAVPVDVLDALVETWKERADFHDERALEADSIGDLQTAVAVHTARSTELRQVAHALKCATHPQPAAAGGDA